MILVRFWIWHSLGGLAAKTVANVKSTAPAGSFLAGIAADMGFSRPVSQAYAGLPGALCLGAGAAGFVPAVRAVLTVSRGGTSVSAADWFAKGKA